MYQFGIHEFLRVTAAMRSFLPAIHVHVHLSTIGLNLRCERQTAMFLPLSDRAPTDHFTTSMSTCSVTSEVDKFTAQLSQVLVPRCCCCCIPPHRTTPHLTPPHPTPPTHPTSPHTTPPHPTPPRPATPAPPRPIQLHPTPLNLSYTPGNPAQPSPAAALQRFCCCVLARYASSLPAAGSCASARPGWWTVDVVRPAVRNAHCTVSFSLL